MKKYWICSNENRIDTYVEFRITFECAAAEAELCIFGASWFNAFFNGAYIAEGPNRFDIDHPQYEVKHVKANAGQNVVYAIVHNIGAETRTNVFTPPFFACDIYIEGKRIDTDIKCRQMTAFTPQIRRINRQLGWMEICDMREIDIAAQTALYDDSGFAGAVEVFPIDAEETPLKRSGVRINTLPAQPFEEGVLAEYFGYLPDEPVGAFYLRTQASDDLPPMGKYYRYDMGRIRLGKLSLDITAQAGTRVEIAYGEALFGGRVVPHINLSNSHSANMEIFFCKQGRQTLCTQTPKGGRYAEVHIIGDGFTVHSAEYLERTYFGERIGSFSCEDELLGKIWDTGVETLRACSEDALIDNPTRERGQWTGDVVSVGTEIAVAAFGDYGILESAFRQSAHCADESGMIAGLCPGEINSISTYAMQWVNGVWNFYTKTGDKTLLKDLFPYAERNLDFFLANYFDYGLSRNIAWSFVDWGYVDNEGPTDISSNLHLISSLRAMISIADVLGEATTAEKCRSFESRIKNIIERYLEDERDLAKIGMHRAILLLAEGFVCDEDIEKYVDFVKRHYMNSFPNEPTAPRLSAPDKADMQLITPYFSNYAFPVLIRHGAYEFVLEQFKTCWGWMLGKGATTWYEVFDERWSHCHQWSGCPTWLLSRFSLGVLPRYDIEDKYFVIDPLFSALSHAEGSFPIYGGGKIYVKWKKSADEVAYELSTDTPITIEVDGDISQLQANECKRFYFAV